jgi:hypothetical protein
MWKEFISKCAEECGRSSYLNVQRNVEGVHIKMCRGMCKELIYLNVMSYVEGVYIDAKLCIWNSYSNAQK